MALDSQSQKLTSESPQSQGLREPEIEIFEQAGQGRLITLKANNG